MDRILVVNLEGAVGGAEKSLLLKVGYLRGQFAIHAACPAPSPLSNLLDSHGAVCHPLLPPPKRPYSSPLTLPYWIRASFSILRTARRTRPDLISANGFHAGLACLPAAMLTKTRLVLHARDFCPRRLPACLPARFSRKVVAVSETVKRSLADRGVQPEKIEVVYNGIEESAFEQRDDAYRGVRPGKIEVVYNGVEASAFEQRDDADRGVQPEKIEVVYNGVEASAFEQTAERTGRRDSAATPSRSFVFGHVGQFVPWKNHIAFLDAAARVGKELANAEFKLIGGDVFGRDPTYEQAVLSYANSSPIADRIVLPGWQEDMESVWPRIDCLVHTATREPFGRVIIEAMAHKVPVIAFDACGPGEIIEDGKTGVLVPAGDIGRLTEAMLRVALDRPFAAALADAAYECVRSRFTADKTGAAIGAIYRGVLAA